jgi:hypothetical protein
MVCKTFFTLAVNFRALTITRRYNQCTRQRGGNACFAKFTFIAHVA